MAADYEAGLSCRDVAAKYEISKTTVLKILVTAAATRVGRWDEPTGRPRASGLVNAVVLTLFLLRHDNAQDVAGELSGCSQATVSRAYTRLRAVVDELLSGLAAQASTAAHREGALVDGFVAPVGERAGAAGMSSGRKHVNGYNVQVVSDLDGHVVDVGDPVPGATHDATAFTDPATAARRATRRQPGGAGITGDKGYPGRHIITPDRKPPGEDPTDTQPAYNTSVNSIRAAVERAISHLKNWHILKTGYRGPLEDLPATLRTVTRLEIYRVWENDL